MGKITQPVGDMELSQKDLNNALMANASGSSAYIGLGDQMLNLGDAESFMDEGDTSKVFTVNLVNKTSKKQKVQFNEIIDTIAGHCLLKEGEVATDESGALTCEGDPRRYDLLAALIKKTPIRVRSIKFNVSDASQLDEVLKYQTETPFETGNTKQVIPSTKQDQNTQNTKMVEVTLQDWQLAYDSTILYTIRPGVSVSMTIVFGASIDPSHALHAKYNDAKKSAASFYAQQQ